MWQERQCIALHNFVYHYIIRQQDELNLKYGKVDRNTDLCHISLFRNS